MGEEAEHGWDISLAIDSVYHISNVGVVLLGISE